MKTTSVFLLLMFILVGCDKVMSDWKVVGQQGDIKLVEVTSNTEDKNTYRQAIPELCGDYNDNCQLIFWKEGDAPTMFPLSDADISKIMVFFTKQAEPRRQYLRWNCDFFSIKTQRTCLDSEFVKNVVKL